MDLSTQSRTRRWWIWGGAVLLGGLVLLAVFSLGVYIGRQGWGAGAPPVVGPGWPQQGAGRVPPGQPLPVGPGGATGGPQAPWPVERPALRGRIRSRGPDGLTLDTPQGIRFVGVTAETRYTRMTEQGEVEMEAEALRPGQVVDIFGRLGPDGRTLTAERVVLVMVQVP